jgi:hypothetical protein
MTTKITYWKNSNTGQLIMQQDFESDVFTDFPTCFYDHNKQPIDIGEFKGFVEIKESKFIRESKNKNATT